MENIYIIKREMDMNLIDYIVIWTFIIIVVCACYEVVFKWYKNMNVYDIMNYYLKHYKKYVMCITALKDIDVSINNANKLISEIIKIYENRKDKKLITSDKLQVKNIINNLSNDCVSITPFICSLFTIIISIGIAMIANTYTFKNLNIKIQTLTHVAIIIMCAITAEIIVTDIKTISYSRKLSFYKLCLEIIDNVENNKFANKELKVNDEKTKNNKFLFRIIILIMSIIIIIFILKRVDVKSMKSLLIAVVGTLIGGGITYLSQKYFREIDDKKREKHYASMIYYDLKSIETYLSKERSSVNIRYSIKWQYIVAQCLFLSDENIEYIYSIYDYVYNYNFHFNNKMKERTCFKKEDINEYNLLKKKFFDDKKGYADTNTENDTYKGILKKLKDKQEM